MGRLQGVEREIEHAEQALRRAEEEGDWTGAAHVNRWLEGLYRLREDMIAAERVTITEFGVVFE